MILAPAAGCAMQEKKIMETLDQPINCNMVEGDIRTLCLATNAKIASTSSPTGPHADRRKFTARLA